VKELSKSQGSKLTGAAIIVMSSIVISRITGFLRSNLIYNVFSDREQTDALFMSFTITDLMFNLLIGGAISSALIPVLSGYIAKKDEEDGWRAVSTFINATFIIMIIVCTLGIIFSPQIVNVMASKFTSEQKTLTVTFSRILFPSVAFMMLTGIINGVLNSYKRFAVAAYGPSIYNIGSALSIVFLGRYGIKAAIIGIMCSSIFYFLIQLVFTIRNLKFYKFKLFLKHPGFNKLFKLAIPSLVASSIVQVNLIISSFYTALIDKSGNLTSYKMASETWQVPYGIFAMAIGMATLPTLSEKVALGKLQEFKDILNKSIRSILILTIPSAIGLVVLRDLIINAIYKWSDNVNVTNAGNILMFFSIALIAQSYLSILTRGFYACNDTKTPLFVGIGTLFINIGLNTVFLNFTDLDAGGMALAYSITSFANAMLLLYFLNKKVGGMDLYKFKMFFLKTVPAGIILVLFLLLINKIVPVDFSATVFSKEIRISELMWAFIELTLCVIVYFSLIIIFKLDEAVYIKDKLINKLKDLKKKTLIRFE
jgi:putative peptidoglycan lipid II flippase